VHVVGDGRPYIGVWSPSTPTIARGRSGTASPPTRRSRTCALTRPAGEIQPPSTTRNKRCPGGVHSPSASGRDFTQDDGHLSAKLSLKRQVVAKDFAADIEALYS